MKPKRTPLIIAIAIIAVMATAVTAQVFIPGSYERTINLSLDDREALATVNLSTMNFSAIVCDGSFCHMTIHKENAIDRTIWASREAIGCTPVYSGREITGCSNITARQLNASKVEDLLMEQARSVLREIADAVRIRNSTSTNITEGGVIQVDNLIT